MTPGMQIRLWLRQASRTQVGVTAVVVAGVVVLLVASLTPAHHKGAAASVAAGAGTEANTGQGALAPATPEGATASTAASASGVYLHARPIPLRTVNAMLAPLVIELWWIVQTPGDLRSCASPPAWTASKPDQPPSFGLRQRMRLRNATAARGLATTC